CGPRGRTPPLLEQVVWAAAVLPRCSHLSVCFPFLLLPPDGTDVMAYYFFTILAVCSLAFNT
ncbi:MAG: hypothetical protein SPJ13_08140, partial [Bacteroidales bacterium]|nr:hypothetical protein [Bacteroidales bacterium]